MIPRILSVAAPLFIYATLIVLAAGVWRQRKKLEWLALGPAVAGLLASLIFFHQSTDCFSTKTSTSVWPQI